VAISAIFVGGLTTGTRDSGIVEQNHRAALRQTIGHLWIPVVEPSPEMLQAQERGFIT
jgi:hypothetical protein